MEVASVLHSIPGRIRLRVPSLRSNPAAAALLEARLSVLPAVLNVESNVVTGTLVLHHEPAAHEALETAVDELLPSLESTAASAGIAGAAAKSQSTADTTPKAAPEPSKPATMPMKASGMVSTITSGGRKALNSATMMNSMITAAGIMPGIREACELREFSCSPPHSQPYPGGIL